MTLIPIQITCESGNTARLGPGLDSHKGQLEKMNRNDITTHVSTKISITLVLRDETIT